jgi:hypothetical protein
MNAKTWKDENDPSITHYTEISQMDLMGKIPPMLLNLVIANEAKSEFMKLFAGIKKWKAESK